MAPDPADLQFDHATYSSASTRTQDAGSSAAPCGNCAGPLGDPYWRWQQRVVCGGCRGRLDGIREASKSGAAFRKALVLGGAVALACGLLYAVVSKAMNAHFSLATLGIGYVVARVVRNASLGAGGRRFQVLAVALTYVGSAMGYLPMVLEGVHHVAAEHVVRTVSLVLGITMAGPFLTFPESPIGLLIVGIGLFEAWKLSRGVPLTCDGPYRAAVPAP